MSRKLSFKWLGSYTICDIVKDESTFLLEKLDRLRLAGTFVGDRLKEFYPCQQLQLDNALNLDHKKIPTLDDFFTGDSDSKLSDASDHYF